MNRVTSEYKCIAMLQHQFLFLGAFIKIVYLKFKVISTNYSIDNETFSTAHASVHIPHISGSNISDKHNKLSSSLKVIDLQNRTKTHAMFLAVPYSV
jgi:hypothetical protein